MVKQINKDISKDEVTDIYNQKYDEGGETRENNGC
jgi:hypothetical protein